MLHPSDSMHRSPSLIMINGAIGNDAKVDPSHLYLPRHHAVEIIQLIEVAPPTPRRLPLPSDSSSGVSSSSACFSSASESDYDSEDEESICSSYCSSDTPKEMDMMEQDAHITQPDDTHDARATRVFAWREKFAKDMGLLPIATPPSKSPKRKVLELDADGDAMSHPPKRSRPQLPRADTEFTTHICAACDASFPTRQNLRQHGESSQAHEACRIAVEYDFE